MATDPDDDHELRPDPDVGARFIRMLDSIAPVKSKVPEAEWNFSRCPKPQLHHCQIYEYGRSSEATIQGVTRWRKERFARADEPLTRNADLELRELMDFYRLFPEFPKTPWLDLPELERRQRIRSLPKREPILVRSVGVERLKKGDAYLDGVSVLETYHTSSIQPVEVNWFYHDKELLQAFGKWLREHRPHRAQEKRGSTEPRVLLNALAAKRLLAQHTYLEAGEITGSLLNKTLFHTQQDWLDAARKAEDILAGRLPEPGFEKLCKKLIAVRNQFTITEQNHLLKYWATLKESEMRTWYRLKPETFAEKMREFLAQTDG